MNEIRNRMVGLDEEKITVDSKFQHLIMLPS